jgi:Flp pilus assembly protein TadD
LATPAQEAPQAVASPGEAAFAEARAHFRANDIPAAIQSFEQAARLLPRSADVQKQLGRAYMRAGRVNDARAAYRRYLDLAPNAPDRALVEAMLQARE